RARAMNAHEVDVFRRDGCGGERLLGGARQAPPAAVRCSDVKSVRRRREATHVTEGALAYRRKRDERHAFAERHAVTLGAEWPWSSSAGRLERIETCAHPIAFGVVAAGDDQIDLAELEPAQPETDGEGRRRAGR